VKFYVVAMLFIVFDIEAIFLYPWAVQFRALGFFGLIEMVVFIGLVFVAYLYVWQKGGLTWEAAAPPADGAGRRCPACRRAWSAGPASTRTRSGRASRRGSEMPVERISGVHTGRGPTRRRRRSTAGS
jgi:hypothetical protein